MQTIFASFVRPKRRPSLDLQRWKLDDGDFVDVDRLEADPGAPHLLILHGLEGSSEAGYVAAILRGAAERGWGAIAMSFRSCGRSGANERPRFYHSGETTDTLAVLSKLRETVRGPVAGVGFSLGGNVILRILAEAGEEAPLVAGAVASVPLDLAASVSALDGDAPMARVYRGVFLRSLKKKALEKAGRFPDLLDEKRIRGIETIEEFDDTVTAPLHGFESASHYYATCSSGAVLHRIRKPTLYLASRDDPFLAGRLPSTDRVEEEATWVKCLLTEKGGHVGFVGGTPWRPRFWGEEQLLSFLDRVLEPSNDRLRDGNPRRSS